MKIEMNLLNQHFPWEQVDSEIVKCFVKGNLFHNNKLINSTKLLDLLLPATLKKNENIDLIDIFRRLNGEYAIVLETPDQIVCAVDRIRSIPIFYFQHKDHLIISDDAYHIKEQIKPNLDEKNTAEFLVTGYVTGKDTLFEDIKQLQAAEILIYDKEKCSLTTSSYFRFLHKDPWDLDEEALLDKLDDCFVNVFTRLIESTIKQGLQIVVPLSGGLDSRIIVAMLKRLGAEDVICFTYGKKNNREVKISKKVADALGYEWHFVEYTYKNWYEYYHSNDMANYEKYGSNLSSLSHKQDLLAIKILKDREILSDNIVFVPGHSGDMLAGSHIPLNYVNDDLNYGVEEVVTLLLKKHYSVFKWDVKSQLKPLFETKINKSIGDLNIYNNESSANAIELFNFSERQAKFIVNSVRAYEFFDFNWRIPLWDSELINFYLKIPIEQRINQALYKKYVETKFFVAEFEKMSRIECTTEICGKKSDAPRIINMIYSRFNQLLNKGSDIRWGRYFRIPIISLFLMKFKDCNPEFIEDKILLKSMIDYKNKEKSTISLDGYQTWAYLLKIIKDLNHRK